MERIQNRDQYLDRNQNKDQIDREVPKEAGVSSQPLEQNKRARGEGHNPQSDTSYDQTATGTHKSELGGVNHQKGSSRSDSSQSSDSPSQSGDTGTDNQAHGGQKK